MSKRTQLMGRIWPSFAGDRVVAVSTEMKDLILDSFGLPADRVRVIPHAVRDRYFRPPIKDERSAARRALGVEPTEFIIGLVGRLDLGMKRHDVLIEAVRRLREEGVPAVALLAGVGSGERAIRDYAASRGMSPHVRFVGYRDAREVYWASDTLALPSHGEAFGIVVAEAMCCGVVPVRTPGPGTKDQIVDGETGFVVPYEDVGALVGRLRRLFENPLQRHAMGAIAATRAQQRFTADRMVSDTLDIYEELRSERTGGKMSEAPHAS